MMENPDAVGEEAAGELSILLEKYPWFQTIHAIQLKKLKNNGHFSYNNRLKVTAAHTTDRSVLFNFITAEVKEPPSLQKLVDKNFNKELEHAGKTLDPQLFRKKETSETTEKETVPVGLNSPLEFTQDDKHSFDEWLKLTPVKPIIRETKANTETTYKEKQLVLIERFIQNREKLQPEKNFTSDKKDLAEPFTKINESLMTETLARVYLQQKNYDKAIQAYKILILKYPEKSGFFADQIKAIEKISE